MSRPKIEVASYKGRRRPLWLQILLGLILAGALAFAVLLGVVLSGAHASVSGDPQVMIVLGCQVKPWGPSVLLQDRLDKALEYMKENPETMLVLSGAKGDAEPCSEADAMETYLLGQGADPDHLLKEEQSFSTVENLAYSRVMIEKRENLLEQERKAEADRLLRAQGEIEGVPETGAPANNTPVLARQPRVGIITSNFHLCRAAMIAKKQDYGTVYGIASEADKVLLVHFSLRDGIALLKDRLMGNL